ncbi:uncharacterized protein LAESUDRAFT_484590 [Laetiporus sulphureus 93-53]|uniref:Uncharacterized protein n=1 Tax=Laetiporus sulphureus 93-53 TaxID=1314785 RepID=A0A165BPI4_9APHY|nr:uncharacterized protein LAESUDRAFT_484590 [Laetiporus sulphureus 93-53]KZT01421.1 hypothetical protein LAESUDRAFT_484590 [Laetiporus sulphureus 93-53]
MQAIAALCTSDSVPSGGGCLPQAIKSAGWPVLLKGCVSYVWIVRDPCSDGDASLGYMYRLRHEIPRLVSEEPYLHNLCHLWYDRHNLVVGLAHATSELDTLKAETASDTKQPHHSICSQK